jgi:serine O-acetyltransferase
MSEALDCARTAPWSLSEVVTSLREVRLANDGPEPAEDTHPLPSREVLDQVMRALRAALFPRHFGGPEATAQGVDYFVGHTLDKALRALHEQVRGALHFACERGELDCADCAGAAADALRTFAAKLATLRAVLDDDVRAAYRGDPAAKSLDEAISCYPGVAAITYHRVAHELYKLGVPLVPRIISENAHSHTGIDIHPGAEIGRSFFVDHGTGVVVGETCRIGERVRLYQGVTLGAKSLPSDGAGVLIKGQIRHPIVEDDVVIYAGATVLGPIRIGRGSVIGGNVWVTRSVAAGSHITQAATHSEQFEAGAGI